MANAIQLLFDPYDRQARLYPALLATSPVVLGAVLLFPGSKWTDALPALVAFAGGCGFLMLMAQIARDEGKRAEARWFAEQGGKPSVAMLRHRDPRIAAPQKARYHAFLSTNVPDLRLPSPEEEREDPRAADDAYQAGVAWLLERTRDKSKFALLFRRNVEYGFRRNLTALRGMALTMDAGLGLTLLALFGAASAGLVTPAPRPAWAVLAAAAVHALAAWRVLTPAWVHRASDEYGRQLLAACDALPGRPPVRAADRGAAPRRRSKTPKTTSPAK